MLGTNFNQNFQVENSKDQKFLSNCLGVSSLVITSDQKIIMGIRSQHVGNPGTIDVPGGHPEPKSCRERGAGLPAGGLTNETISKEIISSCKEEISLELNIKLEEITSHNFHAIIPKTGNQKPLGYFVTKLSINSQTVEQRHKQGGPETDEFEKLCFYEMEEAKRNLLGGIFSLNASLALAVYLFTVGDGLVKGYEDVLRFGRENVVKDEC